MNQEFDLTKGKHKPKYKDLYSVPRRFDLASMLVVTAAFALLFTCMTVLDFGVWAFIYFACLILAVGIAQSAFESRHDPRNVSMVAGLVYQVAVTMLLMMVPILFHDLIRYQDRSLLRTIIGFSAAIIVVSPMMGYLSGALIAGAFLVSDYLRNFLALLNLHRAIENEQHGSSSPWDEDE